MSKDTIDLDAIEPGSRVTFKLNMFKNSLGNYWQIPIMVAKGKADGPVLGVTAALHGNELNGISIIHELWKKIDATDLTGTLICAPVLNGPGFLNNEREFHTGRDLNRVMPGKEYGTPSEVYAHLIMKKIIELLDYHIDIHTASFGRINSLYVRADMNNEIVARMAELQEPQIIVNKPGGENTLRAEASKRGIHAITVEAGDSHVFQRRHIRPSIFGVNNVMCDLGMICEDKSEIDHDAVICESSVWLYARESGILNVTAGLTDKVEKGQVVGTISDIYGSLVCELTAPYKSIVVAKATNPVCQIGSRVVHLGILAD